MPSLDLLYEDQDILVLNKPKGLLVHPGSGTGDEPTLVDALRTYYPNISTVGDDPSTRPGIVHRLDRDTEGVLVVAKTQHSFESLKNQFQNRNVHKRYYAIVHGKPVKDFWEIELPIGRHPKKRHLFRVTPEGKHALTRVWVVKRFGTTTLLDVEILTGRTHQIRVHLAHATFPVVGDPSYGKNAHLTGQKLQAYSLSFEHPTTGTHLTFKLPNALI